MKLAKHIGLQPGLLQRCSWRAVTWFAVVNVFFSPLSVAATQPQAVNSVLTLDQALHVALTNDPWLAQSRHQQDAELALSVASGTLPDPVLSVGFANLPVNGFDVRQEPMTQLVTSIQQAFPRGDSLQLTRRQQREVALQQPWLRQHRRAVATKQVSHLWLETFRAQAHIQRIQQQQLLFQQLIDIAQANYASARGGTRQQDVIGAQLELTRIQDRLLQLSAQQQTYRQQLNQWLLQEHKQWHSSTDDQPLPDHLPALPALDQDMGQLLTSQNPQALANRLDSHPQIKALQQRIIASQTAIELEKQQYRPKWQVHASYGYRFDNQRGDSQADLVSVGLSVDLPLFTEDKQDQLVSARVSQAQAIETQRRLVLREMIAGLQTAFASYQRLLDRQSLYNKQLLTQANQQSDAALTAYTNDDGDFAAALWAQITQLNAQLDLLDIRVDIRKQRAIIDYYLTSSTSGDAL